MNTSLKPNFVAAAVLVLSSACDAGDMANNTASFSNVGQITVVAVEAQIGKIGAGIGASIQTPVSILGANVNETGGSSKRNTATFNNTGRIVVAGSLIAGANVNK